MIPPASEVVERARSLIGARFRPHGRDPRGYDCVGVAAYALGLPEETVPRGYALRGSSVEAVGAFLVGVGLTRVAFRRPGDIAVHLAGPAQLHLGVLTGADFVHADIALARVVERPWPPPWPLLGLWRPLLAEVR